MPTLVQRLQRSVLRLELDTADGTETATAFFYGHRQDDRVAPFLVTSATAVSRAERGRFVFTGVENGTPKDELLTALEFEDFRSLWSIPGFSAPDIAVAPLAPLVGQAIQSGRQVYTPLLDTSFLPTSTELDELDPPGNLVIPGFPEGLYDVVNNSPLIRHGFLTTRLSTDYRGRPAFLVQSTALPGFAGSPVFALRKGLVREGDQISEVSRALLIGMVSQVVTTIGKGDFESRPLPGNHAALARLEGPVDLLVAFKSHLVERAIEAMLAVAGLKT